MLPDDIEKVVRQLGSDGDRVRGALEREFARYLSDRAKARSDGDFRELTTNVAANLLKPASSKLGRQLAEQLFAPDSEGLDDALAKVRARYAAKPDGADGSGAAKQRP